LSLNTVAKRTRGAEHLALDRELGDAETPRHFSVIQSLKTGEQQRCALLEWQLANEIGVAVNSAN
jgi:hypothetical protein